MSVTLRTDQMNYSWSILETQSRYYRNLNKLKRTLKAKLVLNLVEEKSLIYSIISRASALEYHVRIM